MEIEVQNNKKLGLIVKKLFEEHSTHFFYYTIRKYGLSKTEAEDVIQNVFVKLIRLIQRDISADKDDVEKYNRDLLLLILKRETHDYLKKKGKRFKISFEELGKEIPAAQGNLSNELFSVIEEFFAKSLTQTDSLLFTKVYKNGEPIGKIALDMGTSENAVRKRLNRTINKLKKYFEEKKINIQSII